MNFVFGEMEIWFSGQENASHDFRKGNSNSQIRETDKKALINSEDFKVPLNNLRRPPESLKQHFKAFGRKWSLDAPEQSVCYEDYA